MEPNEMACDTPTALRFFASAANKVESDLMRKAADEIERLRLTDAERKMLEWAILSLQNSSSARVGVAMDNTLAAQQLRKLLERCAIGHQDSPVTEPLPKEKPA